MKPPLSPSYKFEKEEEGGEGLEEEEGEAAPPAVIPGSATVCRSFKSSGNRALKRSMRCAARLGRLVCPWSVEHLTIASAEMAVFDWTVVMLLEELTEGSFVGSCSRLVSSYK